MRFADLKAECTERYDAKDPGVQTMLGPFKRADKLSGAAQEFVEAFNYEFALAGKVYLGSKLNAECEYPHLLAEAEAVGIRVETREPSRVSHCRPFCRRRYNLLVRPSTTAGPRSPSYYCPGLRRKNDQREETQQKD